MEKTQNLASTNVPEVIESLRASCNGIGIVMVRVREAYAGFLRCWKFEASRSGGCSEDEVAYIFGHAIGGSVGRDA